MTATRTKAAFGIHEGHDICPHDHSGQHPGRNLADWCSGRWFCRTCGDGKAPYGVWFGGPVCPRVAGT